MPASPSYSPNRAIIRVHLLVVLLLAWALPAPGLTCNMRIYGARLAGGRTPREGRVQLLAGCAAPDGRPATPPTWFGRFCQTQVDIEDYEIGVDTDALPRVVCRQLGFAGGLQQYFEAVPPLNRTELAGNLVCRGDEPSVQRCSFSSVSVHKAGWCRQTWYEDRGPVFYEVGVVCDGAAPRFSGLKLEGGPTAHEGRLLALTGQNGSLGSVCLRGAFHSWPGDGDITGAAGRAARVACSQLGFPGGAAARTGMFFGNTSLPIAARLYSCSGTEARLEQCVGSGTITASLDPSQTWHLQECSRSDDLGVWCRGSRTVTAVRLVGGFTGRDGQLQVQVEGAPGGRWGTLRPADATWRGWDPWPKDAALAGAHRVAAAACRQLGFTGGAAQGDIYGGRTPSESPVVPAALLDDVDCPTGGEPGLSACSFSRAGDMPNGQFELNEGFSVACTGTSQLRVRLAGGPTPREGRVEVLSAGTWRPLTDSLSVCTPCADPSGCPDSLCADMGFAVAQVVCRQLGFGGGAPRHGDFYGAAPAPALAHANCSGDEPGLLDCFLGAADPWYSHTLGVACQGAHDVQDLALVGGRGGTEGRLEMKLGGQWTPVQAGWQPSRWPGHAARTARAVCGMLGLQGGAMRTGSFWGRGAVPPALAALDCRGSEASPSQCALGLPAPGASPVVGISCSGAPPTLTAVRLAGGPSRLQGRLEVRILGRQQWGTVGVDSEREAARAVCRQLGASTGFPRLYPPGAAGLPRLVDEVRCTGEEASLEACSLALRTGDGWVPAAFGAACSGSQTILGVRLRNGTSAHPPRGFLEVKLATGWSSVGAIGGGPDDYLPSTSAVLICRLLGFRVSDADWKFSQTGSRQDLGGRGTPPMQVSYLDCSGNEGSLDECSLAYPAPDDPCIHPETASCHYTTVMCGD